MSANLISQDNYAFLKQLVYQGSGIVLEGDKNYLLDARLSPLARQHGLRRLDDLCALLRSVQGAPVQKQVIEAMTTNETYFFREPAHFDAIRQTLLPSLAARRADSRKLSFWSAASSSGQEAYSLSMLLTEQGLSSDQYQILGTDLSQGMVDRARSAKFSQLEVNRGLPTALLIKYFQRSGPDWQLQDRIRKPVRFEQFDLRQQMRSFGPFDLVFLRNVLVYFDAPTRRAILEQIHGTLFRGGWLLLGSAETQPALEGLFTKTSVGPVTVHVAI